ncbi:MAG: hypothetical protein ACPGVB_10160 [Chitinophagales bacterium]
MQAYTELLNKFPETAEEIQAAATYLEAAPLAEDHWQVIKGFYKQLETNPNIELLTLLINKLDKAKFSDLKSKYPTKATLGYMKRRANRFLRNAAKNKPQLYFDIASELLENQKETIDLTSNWVMVKTLFGTSKEYEQKRHGRGPFIRLENKANIARIESGAPQIWADNPDFVAQLLQKKDLDSVIYSFAAKTLSANRVEIPPLSETQLKTFFDSNSVWLQVIAAHQAYQQFKSGQLQDPQLLANTYFYSPANIRQTLFGEIKQVIEGNTSKDKDDTASNNSWFGKLVRSALGINQQTSTPSPKNTNTWYRTFAANISHIFFSQIETPISKRRLKDMKNLTLELKDYVSFTVINKHIETIFKAEDERLHDLAFGVADMVMSSNIMTWLSAVPNKKTEIRERLQKIFIRKMNVSDLSWTDMEGFVYHQEFSIADFGWHLVSKWSQKVRFTQRFWGRQYYHSHSHSLLHFIQSEYGVNLLLKHSKNQLNWVMWYKQNFIFIYKNALPRLKEAFKPLFYQNARAHKFLDWLPFIAELEEERDQIYLNLQNGVDASNLNGRTFIYVLVHDNEWVKGIAWKLFVGKCLNKTKFTQIITFNLQNVDINTSKKFIELMMNTKNEEVKNLFFEILPSILEEKPQLINRLIPIFEYVVDLLNQNTALDLIKTVAETDWTTIRSHLVKFVEKNSEMWKQILAAIPNETTTTLQNRTIEDDDMLQLFFKTNDVEVLDYHQPIFAKMLYKWIQEHLDMFTSNSDGLFKTVIHKDPKIRKWGFEQSDKVGITIPFALRMMEAGMPETFHKGKEYFENVPIGDKDEVEYVLALCDSPQGVVRSYGIKYFEARKENLKKNDIAIASLAEHTDVRIQEFVAKSLVEKKEVKEDFIQYFDKSVLRSRNKGRKVKELVKSRLQGLDSENVDSKTLMELARSRNVQDREWAIKQLTKMALAGEEVEGFLVN